MSARRAFLAVLGKEARDVLRERSMLAALGVQFFIAAFSAFLSIGLLGLYDPASLQASPPADVAYAGPGGFDHYLRGSPRLTVVQVGAEEALEGFRTGRFDAVVEETAPDDEAARRVSLVVPQGTVEGTLLLTRFRGLLEDYEADLRQERQDRLDAPVLRVEAGQAAASGSYAFTYGTLAPLLLLTPVFLAGAVAGDSFVHELQARTFLLLRSGPAPLWALMAGKVALPVLLAPAQAMLWFGLLAANGAAIHNLAALLGLAASLALLLSTLSVALAARFRRQGPLQAAYALLALLLAVGGLLLPHDPLNLVALLAAGDPPASAWSEAALLGILGVAVAAVALPLAARRIRHDPA